MPTNHTLAVHRALLASRARNPGSPEHRAAANTFYYLRLIGQIETARDTAGGFTADQVNTLVSLLSGGGS